MTLRLYELVGEHLRLQAAIESDDEQERERSLAALDQTELGIAAKTEGVIAVLRGLEGEADVIKAEEERLREMRKRREAAIERLRAYVVSCLTVIGIDRVKTAIGTLYLQKNPPRVEVVDLASVPGEFIRIKREADRAAIVERWKSEGLVPDGIVIHDDGRHLRIR